MDKSYLRALTAASIAFTIVWAINEVVLVKINSVTIPKAWWGVKLAAALGIFSLFYHLMTRQLVSKFVKNYGDEGKLTGEWFQIFKINNYDSGSILDSIRHGPISIEFHNNTLEISAESTKASTPSSVSHWYSNQVSVRGRKLWLVFQSSGQARGQTLGTMELHYQGSSPKKLSGTFHDASPAKHYGSVEIFRDKEDYIKRLDQIIQGQDISMEPESVT